MRPIRLSIAGLHSFRDRQEIRFDELSQAGVFGIFGPTGSGKSTILDAITLALYGTVGRAEHNTRGILNHAEQQLSVSLLFDIGRGEHKITYQVERSYRRKDELSVQNIRSRIIEKRLDGDVVLADKDGEVSAQVKDILGLEPDDFTRAVVLPQGKFAEFLNLKGSERNKMLQRLFSLHQYGDRLGQRLKERADQTDRDCERTLALQQGLGDASPEALVRAEEALSRSVVEEQAAKQEIQTVRAQYESAKQVWILQNELEDTKAALTEHERMLPDMIDLKQTLERGERAAHLMPHIEAFRHAEQAHRTLVAQLEETENNLKTCAEQLEQSRRTHQEAMQKKSVEEPRLMEHKARLEASKEIEAEAQSIKQELVQIKASYDKQVAEYRTLQATMEQTDLQMAELKEKTEAVQMTMESNIVTVAARASIRSAKESAQVLKSVRQSYEQEKARHDAREKQLAEAERNVIQARERLVQLQGECVTAQEAAVGDLGDGTTMVENLNALDAKLEGTLPQVAQWATQVNRLADTVRLRSTAETDCKTAAERLEQIVQQHVAATEQLNELKQVHGSAVLMDRNMLVNLAAALVDGESCPVCGSPHHPNPAVAVDITRGVEELEAMEARLSELEHEVALLTQARLDAERQHIEQEANLQAHVKAEETIRGDVESVASRIKAEYERMISWLEQSGYRVADMNGPHGEPSFHANQSQFQLDWTPTALADWLKAQQEWVTSEKRRLQEQMRQLDAAKQHALAVERNTVILETEVNGLVVQAATAKQEMNQADAAFASVKQALKEAEQTFEKLVRAVEFAAPEDTIRNASWVDTVVQATDEKDRRLQEARSLHEQYNTEIQACSQARDKIQTRQHELSVSVGGLRDRHQTKKTALDEIRKKLFELTEGATIEAVLTQVVDALEAFRTAEQAAMDVVKRADTQFVDVQTRHVRLQTQLDSLAEQRKTHEKTLDEKLAECQFPSVSEAESARLSSEESERVRHVITTFEERQHRFKIEVSRLLERLGDRRLSQEQWQDNTTRMEQAELAWRNAIGALDVAVKTLEDVKARHVEWTVLEEKRQRLASEISRYTTLKSLLSGNKFVEFLAQEQLDFVARQASDRLKQLTRNRYALEVASDGRFVMRDDHNGGVKRPVSTLSGGETFLTSLALALSLSTQIQLRGKYPLEFFFLDEGFGTLDPELLDVVMSTLEKLHLEQMTIGVISHVPELRARMQRRLIVEPAEAAGQGTRVRVELA